MHTLIVFLLLASAARAEIPMGLLGVQSRTERPPESVEPSNGLAGLAGADVSTFASAGNGGLRVTVLAKAGHRPATRIVHTHFAGDLDRPPAGAKTLAQLIQEVWAAHPEVVFVVPDGAGQAQGGKGRWTRVGSTATMEGEALGKLATQVPVTRRVLTAHSGGAYAVAVLLRDSARRGNEAALTTDRIGLLDTPMTAITNQLKARIAARVANPRITYVNAQQPGWMKIDNDIRAELGLEPPRGGSFAEGIPDQPAPERHYTARDEYFGSFYAE